MKHGPPRPWTEAEDLELVRTVLRLQGRARPLAIDAAVAWRLKRSRHVVGRRRRQLSRILLGPKPPRWPPVMDEELAALRAGGVSFSVAGARLGVTKNAAVGRWHRLRRRENGDAR
jgi:hypothetical protein